MAFLSDKKLGCCHFLDKLLTDSCRLRELILLKKKINIFFITNPTYAKLRNCNIDVYTDLPAKNHDFPRSIGGATFESTLGQGEPTIHEF